MTSTNAKIAGTSSTYSSPVSFSGLNIDATKSATSSALNDYRGKAFVFADNRSVTTLNSSWFRKTYSVDTAQLGLNKSLITNNFR